MTRDLNSTFAGDFGHCQLTPCCPSARPLLANSAQPTRPFKTATLSDLEPSTSYEYVLGVAAVDLNWAILQRKASADIELSVGTENKIRSELNV